jgi:hypothetical protein
LEFYAANKDYPEEERNHDHYSRKLKADMFIDDRNIGGLPDWGVIYQMIKENKSYAQVLQEKLQSDTTPLQKRKWWQFR